jgi:peptidoglycan/LPS O-acetylase OafA/YrhL
MTPRAVVSGALLLYCAGLFTLAAFPTSDVDWAEWVVIVLSIVAAIGLVAQMSPRIRVPGEEFAYLVTGWAGMFSLCLYLIDSTDPNYVQVRITLLLLAGSLGAYAAFIVRDTPREGGPL